MSYAPTGCFRQGFTKDEVNQILTNAKAVFIEDGGEQIVSWSSSGHQASSIYPIKAHEIIAECIYALQILDPENYPTETDRTVVAFSQA